jgi:hypothetical protein
MLRSKYLLAAVLLFTVAAPALASGKDLLPLERGIFVDADVPCNQRSNASVVSYWGNALNTSPVECKIKKLKVDGISYSFTGDCTEIRSDEKFKQPHQLTIKSKREFSLKAWDSDEMTSYRWCAPKM